MEESAATRAAGPRLARVARPRCPICGASGEWIHRGLGDRLLPTAGEWGHRVCSDRQCGLVWIDPLPCEEDLRDAYGRGYYTHPVEERLDARVAELPPRAGGVWALSEQLWRATGAARERARLEALLLDDLPPGRVLEIGCGSGERLVRLREAGWDVAGQELDPEAAAVARRSGLTVHLGPVAALGLPASQYDAIVSSHVLEHVLDPEALLVECRRLLRPGGVLTAITPNPRSAGHARFGADWFYLDPPRHLQLFPPPALAGLARRAGFAAEVWTTSARAQIVAAESVALRTGGASAGRWARSARELGAVLFQLYGQARCRRVPSSGEECVLLARVEREPSDPRPRTQSAERSSYLTRLLR